MDPELAQERAASEFPARLDKPTCLACGARGERVYSSCTDFYCRSPGEYNYLRCSGCKLLWISPQPDAATLSELYERFYDETLQAPSLPQDRGTGWKRVIRDAVLGGSLGYPTESRGTLRAAGRLLDHVPPISRRARYGLGLLFPPAPAGSSARLLDVGCGRGWYVRIMRDAGWDAMGVEANPISAESGAREYGIEIRAGSLEEQRFPAGHFHAVASRHVIEHVPDPVATLREMHRIMAPGVWLGLATPNGNSLGSRWFGKHWRGAVPPWHLHLFSPRALTLAVEQAGFRVRAVRTAADPAHWVYHASRRVREGTFENDDVPSSWTFHAAELVGNVVARDLGEELELVAEKPGG